MNMQLKLAICSTAILLALGGCTRDGERGYGDGRGDGAITSPQDSVPDTDTTTYPDTTETPPANPDPTQPTLPPETPPPPDQPPPPPEG